MSSARTTRAQKRARLQDSAPICVGDEGVFAMVSKLLLDRRFCQLMDEKNHLQSRLTLLLQVLEDKCGYTNDLVTYAYLKHKPVVQGTTTPTTTKLAEIENRWPDEVADYEQAVNQSFTEGFNTAACYLSTLIRKIINAETYLAQMMEGDQEKEATSEEKEVETQTNLSLDETSEDESQEDAGIPTSVDDYLADLIECYPDRSVYRSRHLSRLNVDQLV
jgi:hypothetical protein